MVVFTNQDKMPFYKMGFSQAPVPGFNEQGWCEMVVALRR